MGVLMKKILKSLVVVFALLLAAVPTAIFAGDDAVRTIDFATFMTELAAAGYDYDGEGVVVQWSPSSACTDNRGPGGHTCLFTDTAPAADGNQCQRGQSNNAQYQILAGQDDLSVKNVNFVFVPADFTLCMNSSWGGTFSADTVKNAELQLQNTGDVVFENCSFTGVIVSPFSSNGTTTITGCSFSDVYNAYALKDIHSPSASITGNSFDNCGGGIYFEGAVERDELIISDNSFTGVDEYAASGKEFTRGLIQFSAQGDYSSADITVSGNTSDNAAGMLRQLNKTVTSDILDLDDVAANNNYSGETLTDSSYGSNTVYYNGSFYATLADALKAVYKSAPSDVAKVYCKANADVGALTHAHVADNLIIYGNDAYVSGGEHDIEIDYYKYDRSTGNESSSGTTLDKDITVAIYSLDGIAVWGHRNTDFDVSLYFEDCQDMNRVFVSAPESNEGKLNITLNGCSFDGDNGSNNTSVYSNSDGDILIKDTQFRKIGAPINLNHKTSGTQTVVVEDSIFEDCSTDELAAAMNGANYAAPIRIVAKEGSVSQLVVDNVEFNYSEGEENCGNGDILLGDGRHNAAEEQGTVTLSMVDSAAEIMVQTAGYYTDASATVTDDTKSSVTKVTEDQLVTPNDENHFDVKVPAPATADSATLLLWVVMAAMSVMGLAIVSKKRA